MSFRRRTIRTLTACAAGLALVAPLAASQAGTATRAKPGQARAATPVDVAPTNTIEGSNTGLADVAGLAVDAAGNRYVSNEFANTIRVFAPGATGNAAPIRTIAGAATQLSFPNGVAVDRVGFLYVSNFTSDKVTVYAPGATGNVAPVRVISGPSSGISDPVGNTLVGDQLVTANRNGSITFHRRTANGNAAPERSIQGAATQLVDPYSVVLEPDGTTHVGNLNDRLLTFRPGATGNVAPTRVLDGGTLDFDRVPGLDVDSDGNLYLASGSPQPVVLVFRAGSSTPDIRLEGPLSQITQPRELQVLSDHRLLLLNETGPAALRTYAPLIPKTTKPGKVRALKVAGKARAKKRKVTWKAPASRGNSPITGYRVKVKKGGRTLLSKVVSKRSLVLKRGKLRKGKLKVIVSARNAKGFGPTVTKKFRVKK